jgi:hypothetical protein
MTARDTYNATIATATKTKVATELANAMTQQEAINQSGVNVGYNLQTGNYANLKSAVDAANKARLAADFAAEQAKQASHAKARDALRDAGDFTYGF